MITNSKDNKTHSKLMPGQIIVIGFLVLVLCGTVLLCLPVSSSSYEWTSPLTSSFTAVSASCVTGLVLVDTATHWSIFGQLVILAMIQIGGLGFMSLTLILSILIKRRVTPRENVIMAQSLGFASYGGLKNITIRIVTGTFIVEFIGAVVLSTRFVPIFGWWGGIYRGIFHSISAFCNAGFDLMGNYSGKFSSLTAFKSDPVVNAVIMLLIVTGGVGFIVWEEIMSYNRSKGLSSYSKLVILITGILILIGAGFTLIAEWDNPEFEKLGDKFLASFFQSISTRTAGFNTVNLDMLADPTKVLYSLLMFIGGSAGSTAGGVKTATLGLILISAFQISSGKKEVTVFRRRIEPQIILNAVSVFIIASSLILISSFMISLFDGVRFLSALFEASSAFNTVGMTLGITTEIGTFSKILLMFLMFCGRVGILTLTYSASLRRAKKDSAVKYPVGSIIIG